MKEIYKFICAWVVHFKNKIVGLYKKRLSKISYIKARAAAAAMQALQPKKKILIVSQHGKYEAVGKRDFIVKQMRDLRLRNTLKARNQYDNTATSR